MRYFLDTEFDGFGGELISLALVSEDVRSLYYETVASRMAARGPFTPWVAENVIPILADCPVVLETLTQSEAAARIAALLNGDPSPVIVSDWPDDIRFLCEAVITGPGKCAPIPRLTFEWLRVDAYPTTLAGAVQHNAWWDAMALRHLVVGPQ